MKFEPTTIIGAFVITPEKREDERGSLTRVWCAKEFAEHGIPMRVDQAYSALTKERGTLRGFHYTDASHGEWKLFRCVRGSLHLVLLDMRPDSTTYKRHEAFVLRASAYTMIAVPPGVANGYLTLENDTEILNLYQPLYEAGGERGVRWNDPAFGISWPFEPSIISSKDASWPNHQ